MRVSRVQADEMDQTVLLSANSIAAKFEFEIRRALTAPIGQNNFSADQSSDVVFSKCANLVVKFARKILSRCVVKIKRFACPGPYRNGVTYSVNSRIK